MSVLNMDTICHIQNLAPFNFRLLKNISEIPFFYQLITIVPLYCKL
jgi:hypothetical protein